MGRHNTKRNVRVHQREGAVEREALERRYFSRMEPVPEFAMLVVATGRKPEPFHRWLPYRQGFAPELVRRFLKDGELVDGPVLDPFTGSGTVLIETARAGREAWGTEALASVAFVANARLLPPPESLEFPPEAVTLDDAWRLADTDQKRAAVLCAASRTVSGDGAPLKQRPSDRTLLDEVCAIMASDWLRPLPGTGHCEVGDARALPFEDESVGGILTSPPYLSRYDYTRVNRPMERLFNPPEADAESGARQVRARRGAGSHSREILHRAMQETIERLLENGKRREAAAVRGYAEDMRRVVTECARVLKPGAPLTMVVAGAMFGKVYVPADYLILDYCAEEGLEIEEIICARTFADRGPALGSIPTVAPRELVFSARKRT